MRSFVAVYLLIREGNLTLDCLCFLQAPQLPAGWISLQDPSSGKTYYANQSSGQTSWELPPGSTTSQANHAAPLAQTQYTSEAKPAAATNAANNKLVSKYGDGFVTSSSHPELAHQYGNVGTRLVSRKAHLEAISGMVVLSNIFLLLK